MTPTARRIGLALTVIVTGILLAEGATALYAPHVLAAEMAATGWPMHLAPIIGLTAITAAVLYAVPRTALLGAIGIAGFCGGAIATHLRLGEIGSPPQIFCAVLGLAAWAGLALRGHIAPTVLPLVPART